jgi:hypothetical protein
MTSSPSVLRARRSARASSSRTAVRKRDTRSSGTAAKPIRRPASELKSGDGRPTYLPDLCCGRATRGAGYAAASRG